MSSRFQRFAAAFVGFVATTLAAESSALSKQLTVVSVAPKNAAVHAPVGSAITINFDRAVNPATVTNDSLWAFARTSGTVTGSFVFSNTNKTVTLVPSKPFFYGEPVTVLLSHDLLAEDGSPMRAAAYSFRFTTRSRPSLMQLSVVATITTQINGEQSTPYGGNPCDLNRDGWADLVIANESVDEIRIFPNAANGTVSVGPIVQPAATAGDTPSPSDIADFNHDGKADLVVGNFGDGTISILLGNGDATFGPSQQIASGSSTVGVAALDIDGDGDFDVAAANPFTNNVSIAINDGNGVFGRASHFEGGGSNEWPLACGDMNNDGIMDLVIGAKQSGTVIVRLGQGNATFGAAMTKNTNGNPWMLNVGDVNNDGFEDVAVANGGTPNGAILLGNGTGGLGAAVNYSVDPAVVSSDLADLDGDGDFDWLLSSYNGDWRILTNNGGGGFVTLMEIDAPQAASCMMPGDYDNDGDIDLGLLDEVADLLKLVSNSGYTPFGDLDLNGIVNGADLAILLGQWGQIGELLSGDLNGDATINGADLGILLGN